MNALPSLFVSHGSPTLIMDQVPTREFLAGLGKALPRPRAVLAVSAHWDTRAPAVLANPKPHTMHDFYGFPDALYEMEYKAPGAVEVALRAAELLDEAGYPAARDPGRGLDHGAWVPLALMYPGADIPVTQLSIQSRLSPAHHLELGKALAPLREEGVLIMASGNATHNLRDVFNHDMAEPPVPYAKAFADWLTGSVTRAEAGPLLDYLEQGPNARQNHPTPDHYLPLLVALGAGGGDVTPGRMLHDGYTFGTLSMAAYAWG